MIIYFFFRTRLTTSRGGGRGGWASGGAGGASSDCIYYNRCIYICSVASAHVGEEKEEEERLCILGWRGNRYR